MVYTPLTKRAMQIAYTAHHGQVDKSGVPYVFHPLHLAEQMTDEITCCAALLHDTVEDTSITLQEIADQFGPETAAAVDAISRRDGESWSDYLEHVAANPMARQVKISDLIDNSNLSRIPHVTLKDVERQKKYNKALKKLLEKE